MAYDFARSPSQRATYRKCPLLWLYQYGAGWRQKEKKAAFPFGTVMEHVATGIVIGKLKTPEEAAELLLKEWKPFEKQPLVYSEKPAMSWKILYDRGMLLIPMMFEQFPQQFNVGDRSYRVQLRLSYQLRDGTMEMGYLDLAGPVRPYGVDGKPLTTTWVNGIVDFKTGMRADPEHSAERNEQLLSYQLGMERQHKVKVGYVGLCRLVYTTEPKIQWLWTPAHDETMLGDFIAGAVVVDQLIKGEKFQANNSACFDWGGCWAQPLCFASQKHRLAKELERDPKKVRPEEAPFTLEF